MFSILRLGERSIRIGFGAKHLHIASDDLIGSPLVAALILPLAASNAAFNVNLLPLGQILTTDFSKLVPGDNVVPLRSALLFASAIFINLIRGQRKFRHWRSVRSVFNFRILAKSSNQNDFVY